MTNELVIDLHLHSKYSRAVSSHMNLSNMYLWGRKKGLNILSVSDFTHPLWLREAQHDLEEIQEGIFSLKDTDRVESQNAEFFQKEALGPYFLLSVEVSSIYKEGDSLHRIHNLIFAPNFSVVEKINKEFVSRGFNLTSDGRPTFGITSKDLAALLFSIDPLNAIIPAHIWTPWFSMYGSRSGYDVLSECWGEYSKYIFAIETGLSSDPVMNWRIPDLQTRSILSFSDAHSMEKMGREATVIKIKDQKSKIKNEDITYKNILNAFVRGKERVFEIAYTIEFYPEEGKYHYTGHRNCNMSFSPSDTPKDALCPVCKKPLTVGVMHRVEELARNEAQFTYEKDLLEVVWIKDTQGLRPPFVSLVPLLEILSETLDSGVSSQKVTRMFDTLVSRFGSEHEVLLRAELDEIRKEAGSKVAEGIQKVRTRNLVISPGFDNEYGKVHLWDKDSEKDKKSQTTLF